MTFHIQTIIFYVTSLVRYDIPYSDNYFFCGKINDYLMTEIWKNRLQKCWNVQTKFSS